MILESIFNQAHAEGNAEGFASVLRKAGINAHVDSRMD
jgi:hypothetical protein